MQAIFVALRKESVDRNTGDSVLRIFTNDVALRKESVDRNKGPEELAQFWSSSLSARRAWIEMEEISSNLTKALCRSPQGERG